jgi:anti-sigma-K factor RskA
MTETAIPGDDDPEILAAELAFGLIDPDEAARAERLRDTDPAFGAAHARWFGYALALFADAAETPPAHVWQAIERRLPANDTVTRLNRDVARWRFATMAASVALVVAVGGAVWLNTRHQSAAPASAIVAQAPAPAAPMVAMLQGQPGVVSVAFDPGAKTLTVSTGKLGLDAKHTAQLWVIPADGVPRSLGVLPADHPVWRTAPGTVAGLLNKDATLAVSVEPLGGSPTGLPTGPVILTGKLTQAG